MLARTLRDSERGLTSSADVEVGERAMEQYTQVCTISKVYGRKKERERVGTHCTVVTKKKGSEIDGSM
jgi:hypothetical protein